MNPINVLATITDLKAELSRIEEMKHEIESTIETLTRLLESPLLSARVPISQPQKSSRTRFPATSQETENAPIPSDRVQSALAKMQGKFKRGELKSNAINDGYGEIAEGTFANIFTKLITRKQIVCVDGTIGQRDAVFIKAEESKEEAGKSSDFGWATPFEFSK